jgi:ribose transport system ATP-binding protein
MGPERWNPNRVLQALGRQAIGGKAGDAVLSGEEIRTGMPSVTEQHQGERVVLSARALSKSFSGVRVLDAASLSLRSGEVHGLLGENGSGKSTFLKILSGYHAPDPDPDTRLEVNGETVRLPLRPDQSRELGLTFVHQDLALIPSLSVVENLIIGELASSHTLRISWDNEIERADGLFRRFNVSIDPRDRVARLRPVERALLAILRAVQSLESQTSEHPSRRRVLVLDEPTVFLPRVGKEQLFTLIRDIVSTGDCVLFVSHDLDEVKEITDRVSVLKDGRLEGTVVTADVTKDKLVEMIVGHQLEPSVFSVRDIHRDEIRMEVSDLSSEGVRDVSFGLRVGEVLGLAGLVGSGFQEIPYCLMGVRQVDTGTLRIGDISYDLRHMSPRTALAAGLVLVPGDRKDGAAGSLSVAENLMLHVARKYFEGLRLRRRKLTADAQQLLRRFVVRPPDPAMQFQSLSGGNQQKALLGKWLQATPALLLLDEPTQGVDVGARQQIYGMIRGAAAQGACVVCASADYEQLATICDRVLVISMGRPVSELHGAGVNSKTIAEHSYAGYSISGRAVAQSLSIASNSRGRGEAQPRSKTESTP